MKAIAIDSRSDFVAWFSALRLAKFGQDLLSLAYQRNFHTKSVSKASSKSLKPKATAIDFQKVKGIQSREEVMIFTLLELRNRTIGSKYIYRYTLNLIWCVIETSFLKISSNYQG